MEKDSLTVALAQISPQWINRDKTAEKISSYISSASEQGAELVAFGEAILPGYPFWLEKTEGAIFDSKIQKEIHAHYVNQAVSIEKGHLDSIKKLCKEQSIATYFGIIENPIDRGKSLYCTMVYIDKLGEIKSTHRKLMPTYEERLAWSIGDGNGLVTHSLPPFTVGGLNCWENWMPLTRAALYGQGEDLHVAIWPGSKRNTEKIIPIIAQESRSYVIAVSGLFSRKDIPNDFPQAKLMREKTGDEVLADGGSCLAAPDGSWVIKPFTNVEELKVAEIFHQKVREERQNFDPSGHYSRPDVLKLSINRHRQSTIEIDE